MRVWHSEEGWGVIDSDETPGGCWTHFSMVLVAGYTDLVVGQDVEFEAADQDGYLFRTLTAWPAGQERVQPQVTEGPSDAFSATLTVVFDDESGPAVDDR